jgi:predicted dehydrogenase
MLGKGVHSIDLLNWFVGPIESIFGFAERRFHNINMEDVASAVVRYTSGAVGAIEVSTCMRAPQLDRLEVHGTKGSVVVEGLDITTWKFDGDPRDPSSFPRRNQLYAQPGAQSAAAYSTAMEKVPGMVEGFTEQARDFARSITEDRTPCCDGHQGRNAVEVVLAFYRSAGTRTAVALPLTP